MKRFGRSFSVVGMIVVLVVAFGVPGCDSGGPSAATGPVEITKDNRPAGFEDMMKGMGDQMKATAKKGKKGVAKSTAPH